MCYCIPFFGFSFIKITVPLLLVRGPPPTHTHTHARGGLGSTLLTHTHLIRACARERQSFRVLFIEQGRTLYCREHLPDSRVIARVLCLCSVFLSRANVFRVLDPLNKGGELYCCALPRGFWRALPVPPARQKEARETLKAAERECGGLVRPPLHGSFALITHNRTSTLRKSCLAGMDEGGTHHHQRLPGRPSRLLPPTSRQYRELHRRPRAAEATGESGVNLTPRVQLVPTCQATDGEAVARAGAPAPTGVVRPL